jgi:hypothetical protein
MIMLVNSTPNRIPADEIAEQQAMGDKLGDIEGQTVQVDDGQVKK